MVGHEHTARQRSLRVGPLAVFSLSSMVLGDSTGGFENRSVLKDGLDIDWVVLYAENLDLRLL